MNNCGTCSKWKRKDERNDFYSAISFNHGKVPNEDYDAVNDREENEDLLFGLCEGIPMGFDLDPTEDTPIAVVVDGSSYKAHMFTQESFGCFLWEELADAR